MALDGELEHRIVAQFVEVVAVDVAGRDGHGAHGDEFGHLMHDAGRVAVVGHGGGEPSADAGGGFRLPQQQQTAVGRQVAAGEIDCELLTGDGWQIEGQRRILVHGDRGGALIRVHSQAAPDCYVNRASCAMVVIRFINPGA